jgi:site-specific DNA-methyltransferase (adenine-specific)
MSKSWQLHLGDCIDPKTGLAKSGPVDHIITDPPFNSHVHGNMLTNAGRLGTKVDVTFAAMTPKLMRACAKAFAAVVQRWVVIKTDLRSMGAWQSELERAGLVPVREGYWDKTNPMPQMTGDRPAVPGEGIVVAHAANAKLRWNGGGMALRLEGPSQKRTDGGHPTPTPPWLMESIVRLFTDRGDEVCDPFAGGGTTLVAAVRHGRRARGWEIQERYWAIAHESLMKAREQFDMFEGATA